jgi:simple sugar transport system permease protein
MRRNRIDDHRETLVNLVLRGHRFQNLPTQHHAVSGFCSALAGAVYTFYTQSGEPASCVGLELDAIASVVSGGTLLSGGVGFMAGTLTGVLILGPIQTIITFKGDLNTWWTRIVVGLLVLVFILLQNVIASVSKRFRGARAS